MNNYFCVIKPTGTPQEQKKTSVQTQVSFSVAWDDSKFDDCEL